MTVLIIEPAKQPRADTVANNLKSLQHLVGGYIEVFPLEKDATIICNEEGKIHRLPPNRKYHGELFVGTILVVGVRGDAFCSLSQELLDFYTDEFCLDGDTCVSGLLV